VRLAAALAATAAIFASPVVGQPPPPLSGGAPRPAYSPYLNLTRPGGGPSQNYFGLVRPELDIRNNVYQLHRDTQALAIGLATPAQSPELETGHATGYMTHLRYYGTNGLARSVARPAVAPQPTSHAPASGRRH